MPFQCMAASVRSCSRHKYQDPILILWPLHLRWCDESLSAGAAAAAKEEWHHHPFSGLPLHKAKLSEEDWWCLASGACVAPMCQEAASRWRKIGRQPIKLLNKFRTTSADLLQATAQSKARAHFCISPLLSSQCSAVLLEMNYIPARQEKRYIITGFYYECTHAYD